MSTEYEKAIASLKKRRGTTKGTVTRLSGKVRELEADPKRPDIFQAATLVLEKIQGAEKEFKAIQEELIDTIDADNEEELQREQEVLSQQEEIIEELIIRLRMLLAGGDDERRNAEIRTADRKVRSLGTALNEMSDKLAALSAAPEHIPVIQQFAEELISCKDDLKKVSNDLLHLDLEDDHELIKLHSVIKELHFTCSCTTKRLLNHGPSTTDPKASTDSKVVAKLPKLEVPKFNGEILKWRSFWDMFKVSIHDQEGMSDPEKLLYLRQRSYTN